MSLLEFSPQVWRADKTHISSCQYIYEIWRKQPTPAHQITNRTIISSTTTQQAHFPCPFLPEVRRPWTALGTSYTATITVSSGVPFSRSSRSFSSLHKASVCTKTLLRRLFETRCPRDRVHGGGDCHSDGSNGKRESSGAGRASRGTPETRTSTTSDHPTGVPPIHHPHIARGESPTAVERRRHYSTPQKWRQEGVRKLPRHLARVTRG